MPSAMTTRQCQRGQGSESSRAGIAVRMLVGSAMRRQSCPHFGMPSDAHYDRVRAAQFAPLLHNAKAMRTQKLLGILGLALALLSPAAAQDWPVKPVHLIVPYVAGGAADIFGRTLAQKLGDALHQSVLVENKPGANGGIGADYVAKAAADGYTLLATASGPIVVNPVLYAHVPYDPVK